MERLGGWVSMLPYENPMNTMVCAGKNFIRSTFFDDTTRSVHLPEILLEFHVLARNPLIQISGVFAYSGVGGTCHIYGGPRDVGFQSLQ